MKRPCTHLATASTETPCAALHGASWPLSGVIEHMATSVSLSFSLAEFGADSDGVVLCQRQRRSLGRELRDLVFRLCSGGGLLLGLIWGLHHYNAKPEHVAACDPSRLAHHHARAVGLFGHWISNGLESGMLRILVPSGIGLGVGVLVGVFAASLIRLGRKPKGAKGKGPAVKSSSAGPGRWMRARYSGSCRRWGGSVQPGDKILYTPGNVLCAGCGKT